MFKSGKDNINYNKKPHNYRGKKHLCINCKKEISRGSIRCKSCARKGELNPKNKRKKQNHCINCNKSIGVQSTRCLECSYDYLKENRKKQFCIDCGKEIYRDCRSKYCKNCSQQGEKSHNWQGGISFEPYTIEFNSQLKLKIRERDDYNCQKCNITEEEHLIIYGRVLGVHHIDYDKQNCDEDNLTTLCNECNLRVNYNRKHWEEYFQERISDLICK